MRRFQHSFPRKHTAELNGMEVEFKSYHFDDTYYLWSDAVQACKTAGAFANAGDGDKMLVDGKPVNWR